MEKFQKIDSILTDVLGGSELGRKVKKYSIFNHWDEIVGQQIASKTSPERFVKECLYINVENPTWSNELSLMSGQIISKINSFLKENIVKELRFKVKSLEEKKIEPSSKTETSQPSDESSSKTA